MKEKELLKLGTQVTTKGNKYSTVSLNETTFNDIKGINESRSKNGGLPDSSTESVTMIPNLSNDASQSKPSE